MVSMMIQCKLIWSIVYGLYHKIHIDQITGFIYLFFVSWNIILGCMEVQKMIVNGEKTVLNVTIAMILVLE